MNFASSTSVLRQALIVIGYIQLNIIFLRALSHDNSSLIISGNLGAQYENLATNSKHKFGAIYHVGNGTSISPRQRFYWSSWSRWSYCSRSCGGGIMTRKRRCSDVPKHNRSQRHRKKHRRWRAGKRYSNGNRCQHGTKIDYRMCNTQVCPLNSKDFRQIQCESFNKKPMSGRFYRWKSRVLDSNKCALSCQALGFGFHAILARKVIDGTRCGSPNRICLNGKCRNIGCDGVIGSSKILDRCGVCGGSNNTCTVVSGIFTRHTLPLGYNLIATIPKGSCNITVTELRHSPNLLSIRIPSVNRYVINGNWVRSASGTYHAAGTAIFYRNPTGLLNHRRSLENTQLITARGPLTEDLELLINFKDKNPGVKYEYSKKVNATETSPKKSTQRIEPLKISAGSTDQKINDQSNAKRIAKALKKKRRNKKHYRRYRNHGNWRKRDRKHHHKQSSHEKQKKFKTGNSKHGFQWRVIGLSTCSAPCGGGTQSKLIACVREINGEEVSERFCERIGKPSLETISCNKKPCHPKWDVKPWGACSVSCGKGIQVREVSCRQKLSPSLNIMVPEGACASITKMPTKSKICNKLCDTWKPERWTKCSATCGYGIRTRKINCVDQQGAKVDETRCTSTTKPIAKETCQLEPCKKIWIYSNWQDKCSAGCGHGVKKRHVFCWNSNKVISEDSCDAKIKPKSAQNCTDDHECDAKWFSGPWSECSSNCGPGEKTRDVVCISRIGHFNAIVDDRRCRKTKPSTTETCVVKDCTAQWFLSEWSPCTKSCGTGIQTRLISCVSDERKSANSCDENNIPNDTRTCNENKCPELLKDASCMDEYRHCDIVIRSRLCKYEYYKKRCCQSCQEH